MSTNKPAPVPGWRWIKCHCHWCAGYPGYHLKPLPKRRKKTSKKG